MPSASDEIEADAGVKPVKQFVLKQASKEVFQSLSEKQRSDCNVTHFFESDKPAKLYRALILYFCTLLKLEKLRKVLEVQPTPGKEEELQLAERSVMACFKKIANQYAGILMTYRGFLFAAEEKMFYETLYQCCIKVMLKAFPSPLMADAIVQQMNTIFRGQTFTFQYKQQRGEMEELKHFLPSALEGEINLEKYASKIQLRKPARPAKAPKERFKETSPFIASKFPKRLLAATPGKDSTMPHAAAPVEPRIPPITSLPVSQTTSRSASESPSRDISARLEANSGPLPRQISISPSLTGDLKVMNGSSLNVTNMSRSPSAVTSKPVLLSRNQSRRSSVKSKAPGLRNKFSTLLRPASSAVGIASAPAPSSAPGLNPGKPTQWFTALSETPEPEGDSKDDQATAMIIRSISVSPDAMQTRSRRGTAVMQQLLPDQQGPAREPEEVPKCGPCDVGSPVPRPHPAIWNHLHLLYDYEDEDEHEEVERTAAPPNPDATPDIDLTTVETLLHKDLDRVRSILRQLPPVQPWDEGHPGGTLKLPHKMLCLHVADDMPTPARQSSYLGQSSSMNSSGFMLPQATNSHSAREGSGAFTPLLGDEATPATGAGQG